MPRGLPELELALRPSLNPALAYWQSNRSSAQLLTRTLRLSREATMGATRSPHPAWSQAFKGWCIKAWENQTAWKPKGLRKLPQ
jgi:hypothetical protein